MIRRLLIVAFGLLSLLVGSPLWAAPSSMPKHAGRVVLSLAGGGRGPLVLSPGEGGFVGTMVVTNVGGEPLTVSRLSILGDADDVRSPSRLAVRFAESGATSATLPPGASRNAIVSWMPDKDPRVRQAFGHVIVASTDEDAGEIAMGFRAQVPTSIGFVGEHALGFIVLLPLVVVFVAGASRAFGRADDPFVGRVSLGASALQLALALWAWQHFVPEVGREDGNDGFQLVERAVWVRSIGAEWYVGVDGSSIALLVLASIVGLVAAIVADRRGDGRHAASALLASGVSCAIVALDLSLLFVAWQIALVALVMLVGSGSARGPAAAAKLGSYGALGSAAMLAAFVGLSAASGRAFLVDGTSVAHTLAIPELARAPLASAAPVLGVPLAQAAFVAMLVAVAVTTPMVPLHGWLPDALAEAPAEAGVWIAGAVVALGPHLLTRVGFAATPEGLRWAASTIEALGVIGVAFGASCAMAQRDLRRFVAYASIASSGATLFGFAALTAEGIAGAIASSFARGLAAAAMLVVAGALHRRVRTCDMTKLGGLGAETPALAIAAGAALATSLGAPAFAGFWGVLLPMMGAFARHPALVVLLAAALVVSAAAHLRAARLLLMGRPDPGWRTSQRLEPFGGRIPDASPREAAALAPLVLLSLMLGVWPAPLLSQIAACARDTSAAAVEPPR